MTFWKAFVVLATTSVAASVIGLQLAQAGGTETRVKCKLPALAKAPQLPSGYPKPAEVTYTKTVQAGPTVLVYGYFRAGLDEALNEYKDAVARAHYKNLKTEHDPHDAEINYASSTTTGQIALRDQCREANTTYIQITSRPNNPGAATALPSWFTKLNSAVRDLVRETANRDRDGAERAFAEVDDTFAAVKARLRLKAPDETEALSMWIEKTDRSLKAGNLAAAHTWAVNMTKELSDAADKITGGAPVPQVGVVGTFAQLKADAHDLAQEVGFHDTPGTKRALATFTADFKAHRVQIAGHSAKAATLIQNALARGAREVAAGDSAGTLSAVKALVTAVNRAAVLAGAH